MTKSKIRNNYGVYVFPLLLIILFVWGGMYAYQLIPPARPITINEVGNASGIVDFVLGGQTEIKSTSETTLTLSARSGEAKLVVAKIELVYDPSLIETPVVTQGDFLPNTLSSVAADNGKVSFTFAASPDSGGKQGTGDIATIKIKPKAVGTTVLSFGPNTSASGLDAQGVRIPTNILKSASSVGLTFTAPVVARQEEPSPTPTPSPSPTIAPSPSPSPVKSKVAQVTTPTAKASPTVRPQIRQIDPSPVVVDTTQDDEPLPTPHVSASDTSPQAPVGFFRKVLLGWQMIFMRIFEFLFA